MGYLIARVEVDVMFQKRRPSSENSDMNESRVGIGGERGSSESRKICISGIEKNLV